jgi:hypothetical protein
VASLLDDFCKPQKGRGSPGGSMRELLSDYGVFFAERRFYRTLFFAVLPVLFIASTYLGWLRGGGAPDVVLKWIRPETSQAATLYVASPDPAPTAKLLSAPQPAPVEDKSLANTPIPGWPVMDFRRSPAGVQRANPTSEMTDSHASPAQPVSDAGGEPDAMIIVTEKLQEAQQQVSEMRRQLAQAEWDFNLWKQQTATATGERDRARQQVKDLTQQLRQNFLDLNSAQELAQSVKRDSLTEQNRLKQLLKLQNTCQNHTVHASN